VLPTKDTFAMTEEMIELRFGLTFLNLKVFPDGVKDKDHNNSNYNLT
jgi:hypothetical protein